MSTQEQTSENNYQGLLFCLCGPTASGKSSICREVVELVPRLLLSLSTTTRLPRSKEVHGQHYYFVDTQTFAQKIESGEFLEHAVFSTNSYGTEKENLRAAAKTGSDLLFDIDVQGATQLKKLFPEQLITIFVCPPSLETLKQRLQGRAAENEAQVQSRLTRAQEEIRILTSGNFSDYLVVNARLKESIQAVASIIEAERLRFSRAWRRVNPRLLGEQ